MRALYVTPMKHPDDPIPSGDRTIARATEKVLSQAGFDIVRAEACVSFLSSPDSERMAQIDNQTARAVEEIIATTTTKPDLIFTYHCYYKAPDLIGPKLSAHFGVPYVIAEGSSAQKRAEGPWAPWHHAAETALRTANLVLVAGQHDREGLARFIAQDRLKDWPPFLDESLWPTLPRWAHRGHTHLLTVAMMREGDKFSSYRLLAQALALLKRQDWHLTLVGDGPARDDVLALFAPFGAQISWRGALHGVALADAYADADCLVWPAINEALGMVFLEAALQSCPALACDEGGVSMIVRDGETGCLVPTRDADLFAQKLTLLLDHPEQLAKLGENAHQMAQAATIDAAASRLRSYLAPLGLR